MMRLIAHQRDLIRTHTIVHWELSYAHETIQRTPFIRYKMKHISKRNQNAMLGAYCGAFRTYPCIPQSSNHSWAAPLVAPAPSRSDPVTEPSEYRFASRAPVMRRSPSSKHPRPKAAHQGKLPLPFANGKLNMSSRGYRTQARAVPKQQDPHIVRQGDMDNQYDDFLASFQHRIDGMTGQKGGWGF